MQTFWQSLWTDRFLRFTETSWSTWINLELVVMCRVWFNFGFDFLGYRHQGMLFSFSVMRAEGLSVDAYITASIRHIAVILGEANYTALQVSFSPWGIIALVLILLWDPVLEMSTTLILLLVSLPFISSPDIFSMTCHYNNTASAPRLPLPKYHYKHRAQYPRIPDISCGVPCSLVLFICPSYGGKSTVRGIELYYSIDVFV